MVFMLGDESTLVDQVIISSSDSETVGPENKKLKTFAAPKLARTKLAIRHPSVVTPKTFDAPKLARTKQTSRQLVVTPRKEPSKSNGQTVKINGQTVEQHRRSLGDLIKARINCDKYTIAAKTFVATDMDMNVFKALILPAANNQVFPSIFDESSPVIVALLQGSEAVGDAFGKSKIKGGNRMQQWCADRADVIFFPSQKKVRIHWTMR